MLPRSAVLTIDDGSPERAPRQGKATLAPQAAGPVEDKSSSLEGLGGFHGSVQFEQQTVYYAIGVYAEANNGIPFFDQSWKNVVTTFYHELDEARTDAEVEANAVAWLNNEVPSAEIGDIPMALAGDNLGKVMKVVLLADGSGTVPIQLMWSSGEDGLEGPIPAPH